MEVAPATLPPGPPGQPGPGQPRGVPSFKSHSQCTEEEKKQRNYSRGERRAYSARAKQEEIGLVVRMFGDADQEPTQEDPDPWGNRTGPNAWEGHARGSKRGGPRAGCWGGGGGDVRCRKQALPSPSPSGPQLWQERPLCQGLEQHWQWGPVQWT